MQSVTISVISEIGKVHRRLNPRLSILGILLTKVDRRTNFARDISEQIREVYGNKIHIFENCIPMSVRAAETTAGCGSGLPDFPGTAPRSWPGTSLPTAPSRPPTTAPPWWSASPPAPPFLERKGGKRTLCETLFRLCAYTYHFRGSDALRRSCVFVFPPLSARPRLQPLAPLICRISCN